MITIAPLLPNALPIVFHPWHDSCSSPCERDYTNRGSLSFRSVQELHHWERFRIEQTGIIHLRSASSYFIDYANSFSAPSYTILGARLGFEAPSKRWDVFLDMRNLTDERYATAANTTYDARGQDSANFCPGDAFNVTTGVAFRF
ncbi:TonB-dependent receptor [Pseudomonas putida]|nr:TonB-dependent receptor [Pseudomonas putida]